MWEGRALSSLTKADIDALVENEVREDRHLDYKQEQPAPAKAPDGSDFLGDVAAMANGSGGYLIYGIAEALEDGKRTGIPQPAAGLKGFVLDAEQGRLRQYLDTGLDPRLPTGAVEFTNIEGFPDGDVLVVQVRRSWFGPHMVRAPGRHRNAYYVRDGNVNRLLDARGLREAILAADNISTRVRAFRDERLALVDADEMPAPLTAGARLVLHVVPLANVDRRVVVDPLRVGERIFTDRRPLPLYSTLQGISYRPNIDGLVVLCNQDPKDGTVTGYLQVFRWGAIEVVDALLLRPFKAGAIATVVVERELLEHGRGYLDFLSALSIDPPYALMLSLLGVRGRHHEVSSWAPPVRPSPTFDRDIIRLSGLLVDRDDLAKPIESILEPMMHELWQAGGREKCPRYVDGRYDPKRGGE